MLPSTVFGEALRRLFELMLPSTYKEDADKGEVTFKVNYGSDTNCAKVHLDRARRAELDQLLGPDWEITAWGEQTYSGGVFQDVTFKNVAFPKP